MKQERFVIKGTILVHQQSFYVGQELFGSILFSVINSWYDSIYSVNGELKIDVNEITARNYGKIKSAYFGFTDDLHNISINYCLLKETMANSKINNFKRNLFAELLIENLFTNIRSLYDFLFYFSQIILSDNQIKGLPQKDSLNELFKFATNSNNQNKIPEKLIQYLKHIESDLTDIRTIRDYIVHKGKAIHLTKKGSKFFMRISKEMFSHNNLLPNILESNDLDYELYSYLKKIIKIALENFEIMGTILYNEMCQDEKYTMNLYSISNYCIEEFNSFLIE